MSNRIAKLSLFLYTLSFCHATSTTSLIATDKVEPTTQDQTEPAKQKKTISTANKIALGTLGVLGVIGVILGGRQMAKRPKTLITPKRPSPNKEAEKINNAPLNSQKSTITESTPSPSLQRQNNISLKKSSSSSTNTKPASNEADAETFNAMNAMFNPTSPNMSTIQSKTSSTQTILGATKLLEKDRLQRSSTLSQKRSTSPLSSNDVSTSSIAPKNTNVNKIYSLQNKQEKYEDKKLKPSWNKNTESQKASTMQENNTMIKKGTTIPEEDSVFVPTKDSVAITTSKPGSLMNDSKRTFRPERDMVTARTLSDLQQPTNNMVTPKIKTSSTDSSSAKSSSKPLPRRKTKDKSPDKGLEPSKRRMQKVDHLDSLTTTERTERNSGRPSTVDFIKINKKFAQTAAKNSNPQAMRDGTRAAIEAEKEATKQTSR